jgi:hypothetical protein
MNGLYFYLNYHGIMTTNLQEVGVTKIPEEVVEESILKQRQQWLGNEYSKRKSSLKPTFSF